MSNFSITATPSSVTEGPRSNASSTPNAPIRRAPKGPSVPDELWEEHKAYIGRLYLGESRLLEDVRAIMQKRGISATVQQYRRKLREWGFRKNGRRREPMSSTRPAVKDKRSQYSSPNEIPMDNPRGGLNQDLAPPQDFQGPILQKDSTPIAYRQEGPSETFEDRLGTLGNPGASAGTPEVIQRTTADYDERLGPMIDGWVPPPIATRHPHNAADMGGYYWGPWPSNGVSPQNSRVPPPQPPCGMQFGQPPFIGDPNLAGDLDSDGLNLWWNSYLIGDQNEFNYAGEGPSHSQKTGTTCSGPSNPNSKTAGDGLERPNSSKKGFREPMIAAVEAGNLTIVNILLKANPLCANVTAEGVTPLWMASQQGHTKIAKLLIEDCKADVNTKVPDSHRTPLHQAAQGGRTEIVKLLLANGADPDARDSSGVSPLWTAAQKGSAEIVKLLLNLNDAEPLPRPDGATPKVDPNVVTSDGKRTPLHQAAQNGCVDVVRILLERGADPDPRDQHGISPLWSAAQGGFEEIVKMLLATKGADAEVISTSGSNRRPLHQAAQNGHTGVCKLLLAHGVQHEPLDNTNCSPLFFAAQGGHAEIVEILLSKGSSPENAWEKGNKGGRRYCLHQAAQNGHAKVASLLLGAGANVEPDEYIPDEGLLPSSSSDSSDTAEEGPRKVSGYKSRRKYERFLEKKGRTNQQSAPSSPNSNSKRKKRAKSKKRSDRSQYVSVSPLGLAIVAGHIEVVRLLIENGANTNSINNKSQLSPLHLANVAGSEGREDIITLLIENGARVDAKEKDGWTPMMLAAQNGNCNIVDMLIKNGASVDAQGTDGETALWIASQQGHTAIVEKLLQADARSIPTTGSGRYPIHQAAQNGHFEVLKRLVENDPDCVDLSDFNGSTAIAHAAGGKEAIRFHMVEYLISKGAKFISNPGE